MRIRVPATSANLGPGFDTLGMALHFFNHFEATPSDTLSVAVSPQTCVETEGMSLDPAENLLAQAYQYYFEQRKDPVIPAQLTIEAHIPLSRGMGSSSSAIVGGLFLANRMHPNPLGKSALQAMAIQMEGHPDNVVPALMGGIHCCMGDGLSFQLQWPEDWKVMLVIPPTPLSTEQARASLPPHYERQDAVESMRGLAAWIQGIHTQNPHLFKYALKADRIHQPARSKLIPEMFIVEEYLEGSEALGCVISGSGSTLAIYTPNEGVRKDLLSQMKSASDLSHCKIIPVELDDTGAQLAPR